MTRGVYRIAVSATILALATAGCTTPDDATECAVAQDTPSAPSGTTDPGRDGDTGTTQPRPSGERAYLDSLSQQGLPGQTAVGTTVEVGLGICQSLSEGADTSTILDRIRPLTSALAAQTGAPDTEELGRAFVDASRTHLCD